MSYRRHSESLRLDKRFSRTHYVYHAPLTQQAGFSISCPSRTTTVGRLIGDNKMWHQQQNRVSPLSQAPLRHPSHPWSKCDNANLQQPEPLVGKVSKVDVRVPVLAAKVFARTLSRLQAGGEGHGTRGAGAKPNAQTPSPTVSSRSPAKRPFHIQSPGGMIHRWSGVGRQSPR